MGKIRCLHNVILDVKQSDGSVSEKTFKAGCHCAVDKVVVCDDGYSDVHLLGGGVVEGWKSDGFEILARTKTEKAIAPEPEPEPETKPKFGGWSLGHASDDDK